MNTDLISEAFINRLRTATAPSHTHLESLPVSLSITNPTVTNQQYAHYLGLMNDVVKDTETNIFPLLAPIIPDIDNRRKVNLIEADLAYLAAPKPAYIPVLSASIASLTPAFALGIMYVVEGSSLGGRFILKNISAVLGHDEQKGARYFAGYGNITGSRWKSFLGALTQYEADTNCSDEIIAGADYAFTAIAAHFTNASN